MSLLTHSSPFQRGIILVYLKLYQIYNNYIRATRQVLYGMDRYGPDQISVYGGDPAMAGPRTLLWHVVMLDSLSYAASCGRDNGRIGSRSLLARS